MPSDEQAWETLVDRHAGLVWATLRGHGLAPVDAAEAAHTVWLRLAEELPAVADPGPWLAAAARNEAVRLLRWNRVRLVDEIDLRPADDVSRRYDEMSARCRLHLRLALVQPRPSWTEMAAALGVAVDAQVEVDVDDCLDQLLAAAPLREERR